MRHQRKFVSLLISTTLHGILLIHSPAKPPRKVGEININKGVPIEIVHNEIQEGEQSRRSSLKKNLVRQTSQMGVQEKAKAFGKLKPIYPILSRKRKEEGSVTVRLIIDKEGQVKEYKVEKSSGFTLLDQAAVRAASKARFLPAKESGNPVPSIKTLTFVFKLHE